MESMRRLIFAAALALPLGAAEARIPITHEALWLMKRVGAPVVSPDGRWAVFSVTEPAYDAARQISDLWLVPAGGGAPPRRITFTKGEESGVAWSPDSRSLAFSARREGDDAAQIYLLDLAAGGEARRVTSLSTGARAPQFSPDGTRLLFTSAVYPGAPDDEANQKIAAERKARKYSARVYDGFPIRYWDKWLDDARTHLFVQAVEAGAKARDLLAGSRLAGEPGFGGTETVSGEEIRAAWAPDGRSIVFAATTNRNAAAYAPVTTQLFEVAATGGEPRRLTQGGDLYSRPAFDPQGKALYCLVERNNGKVYNLRRIARLAWPSPGEPVVLGESLDRSVDDFEFSPDGRTIYLTAEEHGHTKLWSVDAAGAAPRLELDPPVGAYSGLSGARRAPSTVLVANWQSASSPPEVVRLEPAAHTHRALTAFTAEPAARLDLPPLRHFWFTSRRGSQIHSMLALPPAFDETKKYPLLVLMHGGPASQWADQFVLRWNYHLLAAPGYVVLLTNYTGSTGFGERFAQAIQEDPLRGPAEEINEAADEAIRRFRFIDASRQAAAGASYGGHLANWMEATTTRYRCLISHAGLINLESQWGTSDTIYHREVQNGGPVWEQGRVWREQNPIRYARNFRTPILLTVGERDFRVPLNQTLENWSVLQRLRVPSRLIVFPEANHWILRGEDSRFFYQELQSWLARYLQPAGPQALR
jgi:dipeptidyl aminopeptidase/acylaminoacyl peptidase